MTNHPEEGLRKLTYSTDMSPEVGARMQLVEDPGSKLVKAAADNIFKCSAEDLKPDKDHVGIHTIALGQQETYGLNRNYDGFPKKACATRHDTFVKHGNVFVGHDNRDPAKAVGKIVKSAYNEPMGRIELYLHVNKEKAQPQLHKLATTGDHATSMACKIPFDICTICGTLRKSAADPRQCEHIRDQLGEMQKDGSVVGMINTLPTWFDESFVDRPADRIAWNLSKAASAGPVTSWKMAEAAGIWVPDDLEDDIPGYTRKHALIKKLADVEQRYMKLGDTVKRGYDSYLWELRKAAAYELPDTTIDSLRDYTPADVFMKLASQGVILDATTFFKYALGLDYGALKDDMPAILDQVRSGVFATLYKSGAYQRICRNTYFDVDQHQLNDYGVSQNLELSKLAAEHITSTGSFAGQVVDSRIIDATLCGRQPGLIMIKSGSAMGNSGLHRGAEIYAAYKLSAVNAILDYHKESEDRLLALAAVQNLVR